MVIVWWLYGACMVVALIVKESNDALGSEGLQKRWKA